MKSLTSRIVFCLAALLCSAAPALAQGDAERHLKRSHERLAARDLDGALAELDKAIALKPDYADAYERRSSLRMLKGNLQGALADINAAVQHAPGDARLYAARGRLRMMSSDAAGALADFDSAVARGHRDDEIYASRGHLKMMVHRDPAPAVDDFTAAIALNPRRVGHYLGRSSARSMAGDDAGALVDLNHVIEQHERREQRREAAGKSPQQAPDFDFKSPPIPGPEKIVPPPSPQGGKESGGTVQAVLTQTTITVEGGGQNVEQFEYIHNVAGAYLNRALLHGKRGDTAAALADFDRSLRVNPRNAHAYYSRARLRRDEGQLEAALPDFEKAVELEPQTPFFHLERGVTLLLLRRDAEAEKVFAELNRLNPAFGKMIESRRAAALKQREEKRQ